MRHTGHRTNFPKPREVPWETEETLSMARIAWATGEPMIQPGTTRYQAGPYRILISPPYEVAGTGWHMSISRQDRYPNWDAIMHYWYALVPDARQRHAAMLVPPESEWVNLHPNTFHVHEGRFEDGVTL